MLTRGLLVGFFALVLVGSLLANQPAYAQTTLRVLHSFAGGTDGANPVKGVIRGPAGTLFGTTQYGGRYNLGTVYKVTPSGIETVMHAFSTGADGSDPFSNLVRDSLGNLYGTTALGGTLGSGTVFQISTSGHETIVHNFSGHRTDGVSPSAGLIEDSAGNFYGTTFYGGAYDYGTIFRVDAAGNESVLYNFTGGTDSCCPVADLVRDASGNLYGTTQSGGTYGGNGTVFRLDTTGTETVLHSFGYPADGTTPVAGLLRDAAGNLFGTTYYGGISNRGTVFKLDATGRETVLYSFKTGTDGQFPAYGQLIQDAAGSLYGTTENGGAFNAGTVFKLDKLGNETILYSFAGTTDGSNPLFGLVRDQAGNLYGTTNFGGAFGYGTLFELTFP